MKKDSKDSELGQPILEVREMRTTPARRPRKSTKEEKGEWSVLGSQVKKYFQGEWRIRLGSSQMRTDRWPPDLEAWCLVTLTGYFSEWRWQKPDWSHQWNYVSYLKMINSKSQAEKCTKRDSLLLRKSEKLSHANEVLSKECRKHISGPPKGGTLCIKVNTCSSLETSNNMALPKHHNIVY